MTAYQVFLNMLRLFILLAIAAAMVVAYGSRDWQHQLDIAQREARTPEDAVERLEALIDALPLARSCKRRLARGGDASACEAPETPEEAEEALKVLASGLDALGMALSAIPGREAEGIASYREAIAVASTFVPSAPSGMLSISAVGRGPA